MRTCTLVRRGASASPSLGRCPHRPLPQLTHEPRSPVVPRSQAETSNSPAAPQNPPQQDPDNAARVQLKVRLRQLVTKVNAAALPGPADLAALDGALRELCRLNPTPDSATSDLINGRWVLLYTASCTTLQRAAVAAAPGTPGTSPGGRGSTGGGGYGSGYGGGYGGGGGDTALSPLQLANDVAYRFFYSYTPVLAGSAVGARGATSSGPIKPRGNFQVFDTRRGRVENQARFEVAGRSCVVNVNGSAEVVQGPMGRPRQRLRAVFTSFDFLVDGERRLSLPLSLLNPVGFVDTPYLDEEIRISVGDKGSVFIAAREPLARQARGNGSGGGGSGGSGV